LCYGADLPSGELVALGEPVGVLAAQSIGEPGTQLTLRTFHHGGAAGGTTDGAARSATAGRLKYGDSMAVLTRAPSRGSSRAETVVASHDGAIEVLDGQGHCLERHSVPYGAVLHCADGVEVDPGERLATWDQAADAVLAHSTGTVRLEGLVVGRTVTAGGRRTVLRSKRSGPELLPRTTILAPDGLAIAAHHLPAGAELEPRIRDGAAVKAGDLLARVPRSRRARDITSGLQQIRVQLDASASGSFAAVAGMDGTLRYVGKVGNAKHKWRVDVLPESGRREQHFVPLDGHILVEDGAHVKRGQRLSAGALSPHTLLKAFGPDEAAPMLVERIWLLYREQGVDLHPKHIELVVRRMLAWRRVVEPGDSRLGHEELCDAWALEEEEERVAASGGAPVKAVPSLRGVLASARRSPGFLAAAAFGETAQVLSEAALKGRVDRVQGLVEAVMLGRRIPAGTGYRVPSEQSSTR
jgi:DNA-directed RNA polymerase subunit beta'